MFTKVSYLFAFFSSFLLTKLLLASEEKVSVICPTYDRTDKHPLLHQAFSWQTYENKELLVFDDSPEPSSFFFSWKIQMSNIFTLQQKHQLAQKESI